MITKDNFQSLLLSLGFSSDKQKIYTKQINGYELKANFANEKLIYPEGLTAQRDTTKNFSQPENFVVFECVHNLLQSGYKPEHIILEQGMPGGHGMTGGFCDIIVQDNNQQPYLLIECKTANSDKSKEFSRAWGKMQKDGGQLFNYYNSYRQAQWLCLYSSDFTNNQVEATYHLISMRDNEKYLKNNGNLLSFKTVQEENGSKSDYFKVWSETYQQDFISHNLFESEAFNIGNRPYNVHDLKVVDNNTIQKKYHQFATIMRQHNVSARENAFDKLVNLFLCKVVDEKINPDNLKVYWKGAASDNHYDLQDRLQYLYQIGMKEFLDEEVTYISEEKLDNAFHLFKNEKDETKRTVMAYFTQLKFHSNNPFAFLDVHNEKLFFQNAVILKEIVQMLQDIKLKNEEEQHQFLGDLFEGFLDQGIKQSEGQFFTPMPIVKFLISSLPLSQMLENGNVPKVIDYACGAGHFLTEYASQIKPFAQKSGQKTEDFYQNIYGIEKEYRLSKVAKVSAFMYGQDEMDIIYADALAKNDKIKDSTFNLLVANPPYSVKGFLSTLNEEDKAKFTLYPHISDESSFNSIETFFIEKAKQLLRSDGIAVIVLPSSVLTNGNIYIKCREIILQYFDLIAIAEFGSGTFGKTGTNTATLFLRRKSSEPNLSQHYQNRIAQWQSGKFGFDDLFEDSHLLRQYCQHCGFDFTDYQAFLSAETLSGNLKIEETEIFQEYKKAFDKKKFSKSANLAVEWLKFAKEIEADKLLYFMLAQGNGQDVLVIKMPADSKEKKAFLGYEWSSAKGNEGIKYLTTQSVENSEDEGLTQLQGINKIQTPLFNPQNLSDESKLNYLVRQNFSGSLNTIPEHLASVASVLPLTQMLDFGRVEFDKAIRTSVQKKIEIMSKYPLVKLGDVVFINEKTANPEKIFKDQEFIYIDISSVQNGTGEVSFDKIIHPKDAPSRARRIVKNKDILLATVRPNLKAFAFLKDLPTENILASTGFAVLTAKENLMAEYLNQIIFQDFMVNQMIAVMDKGQYPSINETDISNFKIPLPPLDIQQKIVKECEKIDEEFNQTRMKIEEYRAKIAQVFNELEVISGGVKRFKINELCVISSGGTPSRSQAEYWGGSIPWVKTGELNHTVLMDTEEKITQKGLENSSAKLYSKGSIIIAMYGATIGQTAKLGIDATTNQACAVLFDFNEKASNDFVWYFLRTQTERLKQLAYGSAQPNLNAKIISEYSIPIPDLETQKVIIAQIAKYEAQIAEYEAKMANVNSEKKAILAKYL